jgi:diacylglycerol kinase
MKRPIAWRWASIVLGEYASIASHSWKAFWYAVMGLCFKVSGWALTRWRLLAGLLADVWALVAATTRLFRLMLVVLFLMILPSIQQCQ